MDGQLITALAVPIVGVLGSLLTTTREPAAYRRLKHAAEALAAVPAESEPSKILGALVVTQAEHLQKLEKARAARELNVANLLLSIIFAGFGAFVGFWLWNWTMSAWGTPWGGVVIVVSTLAGLLIALFIAASFATIYNPRSSRRGKAAEG